MKDEVIIEKLDAIQCLCIKMELLMNKTRKEGRMMNMEEASTYDGYSRELQMTLKALPENPCGKLQDPKMQADAIYRFQQIKDKMKTMLEGYMAEKSAKHKRHGSSPEKVKAYGVL